jgi:hypothetical protein
MAGAFGPTDTFRLSTNVRLAKFSCLIKDATDSTQTKWYASVPPSSDAYNYPVAGVTLEQYLEPNQFYPEDTDPTTITGTTPSGGYVLGGVSVSLDRGVTLAVSSYVGMRVYAAGAVTAGETVYIADQYGRVSNLAGVGSPSGAIFPVGVSKSKTTAANQILFVDLSFAPVSAI